MAALLLLVYITSLPVILFNRGAASRAAADQGDFHLPVIRQFMAQWPHPDFRNYASSTTPGYHLVVATIGRLTRSETTALRLIGSIFTAGLLVTLGVAVGRKSRFVEAISVCLPVVASVYVFSSGAFLLPENAGWWGVLGVMLIALRDRFDLWTLLLGAIALVSLVLVRQSHLWAALPLLASAYCTLSPGHGSAAVARTKLVTDFRSDLQVKIDPGMLSRLGWMLLAIAPALLFVAWFRHHWHGNLVPPNQVSQTTGGNTTAPAVILAVTGIVAPFFCGFLPNFKNRSMKLPASGQHIFIGAIAGAIIAAIPISTYDVKARRFSGIWNLVNHVPYICNRSPLLIALAAVGGASVVVWLSALPKRDRIIWATAVVAFTGFQMLNANPWQRYYEPFILIAAALTAPVIARQDGGEPARWAPVGPLMLAFLLGSVTFLAMAGR